MGQYFLAFSVRSFIGRLRMPAPLGTEISAPLIAVFERRIDIATTLLHSLVR